MPKKRSKVQPKYKTKYRVRNWSAYERGLVRRGDVTIWFNAAAISAWEPGRSGARGRPRHYSVLAIETALALRLVFGLPWRQDEAQNMEAMVACDRLNRMSSLGLPDSVAVVAT